jgi:hypothetical protein
LSSAVGEKLQEQTNIIRTVENHECKELVLAKDQVIEGYMATAFPNIKIEYGRNRVISASAFDKGYRDAGQINLRPGIRREDSQQLAVIG